MGVPKFYRWISERYSKINQVITDSALLPEFDHLYLDMNGIIHGCTHPNDLDVSVTLSEKDMMLGIMHYLDRIITQIVKPKVSLFMAIDGVAPRAKLNQQRSRRFRSAKDMAEVAKDKSPLGSSDDGATTEQAFFDSNCITPGTEFMANVSDTIKYYICKKLKEDPLWRNLKVIYSGHEIPGEGEHKIMEHIRDMRSQPGYQPNTRHCMYGQDADLIMLGLVSHEPHFTLLREIVHFGAGFNRNNNALKAVMKFTKQSDFQLLHLSILREYLSIEFGGFGSNVTSHDLESIIDDFVFLTFLVGNDFLPHMPSLDIGDGAFDLLFNTYREQRATWGDGEYLTFAGEIKDAQRLETFLDVIGAEETTILEKREDNEADFVKRRRIWDKRDGKPAGPSDAELAANEKVKQATFTTMMETMTKKHGISNVPANENKLSTNLKKKDFKGRYYFEKLNFTPWNIENHVALRKSYIEGLIWCLAYYYRGCISWGWFYPYHYGPMLSDLTDLTNVFKGINFKKGRPLKPFEQLMGCLPPASANLVPRPYRKLMFSSNSPIIQFYPENFDVDMNGKRNPWEGVNILPFINVDLLKETISSKCPDNILTSGEKVRNAPGEVFCYSYDPTVNATISSCNRGIGLPDIINCHSRRVIMNETETNSVSFKPTLIPGTKIPFPGFPSLNVLPIVSSKIISIGLNCFGSPSKYPNVILSLRPLPQLPTAIELADNILGKSLFINWPMMHEAKVTAVSDENCTVRFTKRKKKVLKFNSSEKEKWLKESSFMVDQYAKGDGTPGSGGVEIGDIQIRLKLLPLQGMKTSLLNGSATKIFGNEEADVPIQMALWSSPAPDPRFEEKGPLAVKDRFPPSCSVILRKGKYRGCLGKVISEVDDGKVGVTVTVLPPEPPFGLAIARSVQESYISLMDTARLLKIHPSIFGKVTGSLLFQPGHFDIGLNLKYQKNFCVLGYSRRIPETRFKLSNRNEAKKKAWSGSDSILVVGNKIGSSSGDERHKESGKWEFTPKAVRLVAAYRQTYPLLFNAISKKPNDHMYNASILGPGGAQTLTKIREWLNNVETAKSPRTPCTTEAMPVAAVSAVQRAADIRVSAKQEDIIEKLSNIKVPTSALYREGSTTATDVLQSSDNNNGLAPELGDRVANLCANGLPFGARGTVVGIHHDANGCVEVVMDEESIGCSTLQGTCANFRGILCLWNDLIKISASDSLDIVDEIIPPFSGSKISEVSKSNKTERQEHSLNNTPKTVKLKNVDKIDCGLNKIKNENVKAITSNCVSSNHINSIQDTSSSKIVQVNSLSSNVTRSAKKGVWREALGPNDAGIGFKSLRRGGKSGLKAWRQMVSINASSNGINAQEAPSKHMISATAGLKAMLGVDKEPSNENGDTRFVDKVHVESLSNASPPMIQSTSCPLPMLAPSLVSNFPDRSTAADIFYAMMNENQAPSKPSSPSPDQNSQSVFNFAYVNDAGSQIESNMKSLPHNVVESMDTQAEGIEPSTTQNVPGSFPTDRNIPASQSPPLAKERNPKSSNASFLLVPSVTLKAKNSSK